MLFPATFPSVCSQNLCVHMVKYAWRYAHSHILVYTVNTYFCAENSKFMFLCLRIVYASGPWTDITFHNGLLCPITWDLQFCVRVTQQLWLVEQCTDR